MSKQCYALWREVNHHIFGDRCKEVWDFLWGAPRDFERGHLLMWLCQMVYAEVILGVDIDWSTISRTSAELRTARRVSVIPSAVLGRNAGHLIPLAWQAIINPPAAPNFIDFLAAPNQLHGGNQLSHPMSRDISNTMVGMPVEPPSRQQRRNLGEKQQSPLH